MDFSGKVALVTGASRRIGAAVALALGRRGCTVVVNYLAQKDRAESVAAEIEEAGGRALVHQADVRNRDEVRAMVERTVETFGAIDILINNARLVHPVHAFLELDWKEHMLPQIDVHLGGAFHCCQEAVPHMLKKGSGVIVNMSSTSFRSANPRYSAYSPAKAALRSFTLNLAAELSPLGIRVNSVSPGTTESPQDPSRRTPAQLAERLKKIPLGHIATPDEIADTVVFMCSDDARYITGAELIVSGGATMVF